MADDKMVFVNRDMLNHLFASVNAKVIADDIEKMKKSAKEKGEEFSISEEIQYSFMMTIHVAEVQKKIVEILFNEGKEE